MSNGGNFFIQLLPLVLIFVVFYFLLIRPQQKKAKQHQLLVSSLKRGDKVVTSGGIEGKVVETSKAESVEVEIANNVVITVRRAHITQVVQ